MSLRVSDDVLTTIHDVSNAAVGSIISTFGIVGNVINLVVFHMQGFHDTVNISLFALSLSDLSSLITLQLCNLYRNSLFIDSVAVIQLEAQHLMAAWPHGFFTRLTGAITAYITLERCLCVLVPLKFKTMITPKFSVAMLVLIFLTLVLTLVPEYLSCYYGWKFDPTRNRTAFGLLFKKGRGSLAHMTYIMAGATKFVAFCSVIVFTSILAVKLVEKSKWRASISISCPGNENNRRIRETRTVMMITLIATIYFICFLPYVGLYLLTAIVPDFYIFREYSNEFVAAWAIAFMIDSVNASVNTLVYYRMSTKYRKTVNMLFSCCFRQQVKDDFSSPDNDDLINKAENIQMNHPDTL